MSKKKISVDQVLNDIVYINNQIDGLKILLENKKDLVKKYFSVVGTRSVKNDEVTAYVRTNAKVEYDVEKIKEKLAKSLWSLFIGASYSLDFSAFKSICKENGIDPKLFKTAIKKDSFVDTAALDELYKDGKISLVDLEGCYHAEVKDAVSFRFANAKNGFIIPKPE